MSEIKVNSIKGVGASTPAISIDNASGTCTANITNNLSNRNLIINGAMQVAQRGTSATVASNGYWTVDRFKHVTQGNDEQPTSAQVDVASGTTPYTLGFRKAIKITNGNQTSGAGSSDRVRFGQDIEAQDIANSGWNYADPNSKITLSCWVKSSVAQNFYFNVKTHDGTQQNFPFETGSLTADNWTKITKTISGNSNLQFDNNTSTGLEVRFNLFLGTDFTDNGVSLDTWAAYAGGTHCPDFGSANDDWYLTNDATFEMTGLQIEVGSVATDFEHRSFAQELALCYRYYYRESIENTEYFNGLGKADSDGNSVDLNLKFPVTMRTTPTAVEQAGSGTNYLIRGSSTLQCTGVPTYGDATQHSATIRFTRSSHGISTNNVANCGAWGASFLGFSAEL